MFSRRKRNYRVFVISALIVAVCALIIVLLWPDAPEYKPKELTTNAETNIDVESNTNNNPNLEAEKDIEQEPDNNLESNTNSSNKTYYIVKKSGDIVSVFFVTEDGSQIKLEDTEIIYELLPPEDQKNFEKGVVLEEQEDLTSLLQDFEG